MSIVVSDTSPFHALHHLGLLDILSELYGQVFAPPAVAFEALHPQGTLPPLDITTVSGIVVMPPANTSRFASPSLKLDPGEIEALALAIQLQADVILIDERRGRQVALKNGLQPVGVLGTLVGAKLAGLVPAVAPLIDSLVTGIGFRVSTALRRAVLLRAGEANP